MSPSRVVLLAVSLLRRLHRGPAMASDNWEELLGPAVQKKVVVDGHGDSPDLGSLVNFDWRGSVLLDDGTTGVAFAERKRATARIGDGDEIPGRFRGVSREQGGIWRHETRFVDAVCYHLCVQSKRRHSYVVYVSTDKLPLGGPGSQRRKSIAMPTCRRWLYCCMG